MHTCELFFDSFLRLTVFQSLLVVYKIIYSYCVSFQLIHVTYPLGVSLIFKCSCHYAIETFCFCSFHARVQVFFFHCLISDLQVLALLSSLQIPLKGFKPSTDRILLSRFVSSDLSFCFCAWKPKIENLPSTNRPRLILINWSWISEKAFACTLIGVLRYLGVNNDTLRMGISVLTVVKVFAHHNVQAWTSEI